LDAFFSFFGEGKGFSKAMACLSQTEQKAAIRGAGILNAILCYSMSALARRYASGNFQQRTGGIQWFKPIARPPTSQRVGSRPSELHFLVSRQAESVQLAHVSN
jgi:hypothetical protein